MATQWGRRETVIWPPKSPIYTWGAAFLALVLTCAFLWCRFTFGQNALQQFYTPAYVRSAAGAMFKKHDKYRLLYVGNGGKVSRIARTEDVSRGRHADPGWQRTASDSFPERSMPRDSGQSEKDQKPRIRTCHSRRT